MRKLLTTKKYSDHEKHNNAHTRQPNKHQIQQPKHTITSNWWTRNDSSNVSGVLHPDKYTKTPRKLQDTKYEKLSNKSKGVHRKCQLGSNNCYCRYKTTKPKISAKPKILVKTKKYLPVEDSDDDWARTPVFLDTAQTYHRKAIPNSTKHHNSINSEYFEETSDYTKQYSDSVHSQYFNKGYHDESESSYGFRISDTDFSQNRQYYDPLREEDYYNLIRRYLDEEEAEERNNNTSLLTLVDSRCADSQRVSSSYTEEQTLVSKMTTEELKEFRDKHYFETHYVDNLATDIPEHTCVHQFQLDDRLLPEPINVDPYGMSRCTVCNKPLEDENLSSESSSANNLLKYHQLGRAPRQITVCGDKSQIEIKYKDAELETYNNGFIGRIRRPEYVNTFALRQQKMCC